MSHFTILLKGAFSEVLCKKTSQILKAKCFSESVKSVKRMIKYVERNVTL